MKANGFTLIELILVISVGLTMSFLSFSKMISDQETNQSRAVGEQLKKIGEASNLYITNHYQDLSTLKNATGNVTDVGPRTCVLATQSCSITLQTLINDGLLPPSYKLNNIFNANYKISIKRSGTSPYYNISGLVITDKPLITGSGDNIRYDMLGKAIQAAGVDSGMTRNTTTIMEGFKGLWQVSRTDYTDINQQGLLGYQIGFNTAYYAVFLRRDGTLPMTGQLNMDSNDINNARNITASANIKADGTITGGVVTSESNVYAKNGYGDTIYIGGDNSGSDYELYMSTAGKPLSIYNSATGGNPSTTNKSTPLLKVSGAIASGDINSVGDVNTAGNVNSGNWLKGKNGNGNQFQLGGDSNGDYDFVFDPSSTGNNVVGFFSLGIATPFDFNFRGNISALTASGSARNVYLDGDNGNIVASGNITSSKNIYGQYLTATSNVLINSSCAGLSAGTISKNANGELFSCQSNLWKPVNNIMPGTITMWGTNTVPNGWFELNGQAFNTSQNPGLTALFPSGTVPDFRGYFVRSLDRGVGRDPDSGRGVLSTQSDAIRNIYGSVSGANRVYFDGFGGAFYDPGTRHGAGGTLSDGSSTMYLDDFAFDASRQVPTAPENRPKNISVLYIIKGG